jgi:DNA-binding XRE family transcriptional regulator
MIGKRIRELREYLGKGRQAFANELGIPKQTLINVETRSGNFRVDIAQKVCQRYPRYALWLMTGDLVDDRQEVPLRYGARTTPGLQSVAEPSPDKP